MHTLFVYDYSVSTGTYLESVHQADGAISLFPLIEDDELRKVITNHFQDKSSTKIDSIDSSRFVDHEVTGLNGLADWSFDLGVHEVEGKSLRKRLRVPNLPISSWWFGHFSERNPLKSMTGL